MQVSVNTSQCPSSQVPWYKTNITDQKEISINRGGQNLQKIY